MTGTIEYLEEKELFSLFRALSAKRDYLVVRLLFELGCTLDELVSIRVRDIDTANGSIILRSQKGQRTVRISRKASKAISSYTSQTGLDRKRLSYLFQTSRKTPLTPRRIFQIVEQCFRKAHISKRASPQIIKYSHIVHAYKNSVPMEEIERQVGIKKQRLAQIFEQVEISRDKDAYSDFFQTVEEKEDGP